MKILYLKVLKFQGCATSTASTVRTPLIYIYIYYYYSQNKMIHCEMSLDTYGIYLSMAVVTFQPRGAVRKCTIHFLKFYFNLRFFCKFHRIWPHFRIFIIIIGGLTAHRLLRSLAPGFSEQVHYSFNYSYIYIYIYMLLEIFPVSPRGFESFTRRFGSPFGAIFKRGGGRSTWPQPRCPGFVLGSVF